MASERRDMQAAREDILCAYVVLRELNDYAQHYSVEARQKMVARATSALRSAWAFTGADRSQFEPQLSALLASGEICRRHRKGPTSA